VLTGFLPPEDGTGRGKGYFAYSAKPKAGLPTGTQVRNVALISFDGQTYIATNQIDPQNPAAGTSPNREALNTIDSGLPSGTVLPLPAVTTTGWFPVSWSGQDDPGGSGVGTFDVYVSDNGGPFTLWQSATAANSAVFTAAQSGHTYGFYAVATDHVGNVQPTPAGAQATTTVTLPPAPYVNLVTPTGTGVSVLFNTAIDPSVLNLYDQAGQFGPADVTLVGPNGLVRGSLVLTRSTSVPAGQFDGFTFVATGGSTAAAAAGSALPAGTYTLTLVSGANAFKDLAGNPLDGGNNFVTSFTVAAPPALLVSLPSFARGAGQPVHLPTDTGAGLPVYLSDATGVGSVSLTFTYDNTLLAVNGFTPNAAIPGVSSTFTTSRSGTTTTVTVTVTGTAAFGPAGPFTLGTFAAAVPATAPYGAKAVLRVGALTVTAPGGASVPALGVDGLQLAAYVGDANHTRTYDTADLLLENRLFVGSVTGLVGSPAVPTFPLVDPGLVTSIGGTGAVGAADIVQLARQLVGQTIPNLPAIPTGGTPPPDGVDPRVYIPTTLAGPVGQTVRVPVRLDVTDPKGLPAGIGAVSFALAYDPAVLTFRGIAVGSLLADSAAGFSTYLTSVTPGLVRAVVTSSRGTAALPFGSGGALAELTFTVNPNAVPGRYVLNLLDGAGLTRTAVVDNGFRTLALSPAPRDFAGDPADGVVTVTRPGRGRRERLILGPAPSSDIRIDPSPLDGHSWVDGHGSAIHDRDVGDAGVISAGTRGVRRVPIPSIERARSAGLADLTYHGVDPFAPIDLEAANRR
jgi:hypothetical protein